MQNTLDRSVTEGYVAVYNGSNGKAASLSLRSAYEASSMRRPREQREERLKRCRFLEI
jgi:hypothetical protein